MWFRMGYHKGHIKTFNKVIDNAIEKKESGQETMSLEDVLPYLDVETEARKWKNETIRQFKWLLITKPIEICSTHYALIRGRLWKK